LKTFIGGDGSNTTAAAVALLKTSRQLQTPYLVLIGEAEDPDALWFTDWSAPLSWPVYGVFQPASIRPGKVKSQIGVQVDSLDFSWSPPESPFTNNIATTSPYQKAQLGAYDNKKFRMWRALMNPAQDGDVNTYGACEWFGGWIGDSTPARDQIQFKIDSFVSALNNKIPVNVIESTSAMCGFLAGTPVLADGETNVPTFTVVAGSGPTVILGQCIQPTANKIYGRNKFLNGYLVFISGSLKGFYSAVGANQNFNFGGGIHYNQFQIYRACPWDPEPGSTFYVATKPPLNSQDPIGGPYQYMGFDFLPNPESNL
jgi:hypothetical protein